MSYTVYENRPKKSHFSKHYFSDFGVKIQLWSFDQKNNGNSNNLGQIKIMNFQIFFDDFHTLCLIIFEGLSTLLLWFMAQVKFFASRLQIRLLAPQKIVAFNWPWDWRFQHHSDGQTSRFGLLLLPILSLNGFSFTFEIMTDVTKPMSRLIEQKTRCSYCMTTMATL